MHSCSLVSLTLKHLFTNETYIRLLLETKYGGVNDNNIKVQVRTKVEITSKRERVSERFSVESKKKASDIDWKRKHYYSSKTVRN